jgi:hypothetical protein
VLKHELENIPASTVETNEWRVASIVEIVVLMSVRDETRALTSLAEKVSVISTTAGPTVAIVLLMVRTMWERVASAWGTMPVVMSEEIRVAENDQLAISLGTISQGGSLLKLVRSVWSSLLRVPTAEPRIESTV